MSWFDELKANRVKLLEGSAGKDKEAQIIVINMHLLEHVIAIIETAFIISRAPEEKLKAEIRILRSLLKEVEDDRRKME